MGGQFKWCLMKSKPEKCPQESFDTLEKLFKGHFCDSDIAENAIPLANLLNSQFKKTDVDRTKSGSVPSEKPQASVQKVVNGNNLTHDLTKASRSEVELSATTTAKSEGKSILKNLSTIPSAVNENVNSRNLQDDNGDEFAEAGVKKEEKVESEKPNLVQGKQPNAKVGCQSMISQ